MASAPVRKGKFFSLRKNAPSCDEMRVARPGPRLKRSGCVPPRFLGARERIVRTNWRGTDGQRKRGGIAKSGTGALRVIVDGLAMQWMSDAC